VVLIRDRLVLGADMPMQLLVTVAFLVFDHGLLFRPRRLAYPIVSALDVVPEDHQITGDVLLEHLP
jgi:hypothetical protein